MADFKNTLEAEEKTFARNGKKTLKRGLLKALPWTALSGALLFVLKGTQYLLLLLSAAAIHEGGHIIFAKLTGVPLVRASGGLFGIWLRYDFSSKSYFVQIIVSCGGALFNVIAAAAVLIWGRAGLGGVFFVFSNLALAVFNLMPISGFDGIGILKSLLLLVIGESYGAEKICRWVSCAFSGAFFLLSVYIQMRGGVSLTMLLLSFFLLYNCAFRKEF